MELEKNAKSILAHFPRFRQKVKNSSFVWLLVCGRTFVYKYNLVLLGKNRARETGIPLDARALDGRADPRQLHSWSEQLPLRHHVGRRGGGLLVALLLMLVLLLEQLLELLLLRLLLMPLRQ